MLLKILLFNYTKNDKHANKIEQMINKIGILMNSATNPRKHLRWSLFLNAFTDFKSATKHRCFPVKFAKFLVTAL